MHARVILVDESLAYIQLPARTAPASPTAAVPRAEVALTGGVTGGVARPILKLSTADLMLCTDRTPWSKASCSPRAAARATARANASARQSARGGIDGDGDGDGLIGDGLIGGQSQACSPSTP